MNARPELPAWREIDTAERDRLLIDFWTQGLSATVISGKFSGATRSAVLGRIHRLEHAGKLTKNDHSQSGIRIERSRKRGGIRGGKPSKTLIEARKSDPKTVEVTITRAGAWDPIPGVEPVAIADLESRHCRWPVETEEAELGFFCGAPRVDGCSYCNSHLNLAKGRAA